MGGEGISFFTLSHKEAHYSIGACTHVRNALCLYANTYMYTRAHIQSYIYATNTYGERFRAKGPTAYSVAHTMSSTECVEMYG